MKQLLENWQKYLKEKEGKSVLYHASSPSNRRNIMSKGLEPGQEASYGPPAVYLFTEDFLAQNYVTNEPMDVWEVDVAGLEIKEDPEDPKVARYYDSIIDKGRLNHMGIFYEGEPMPEEDYNPEDWEK